MSHKQSAGLLLFRRKNNTLEVMLIHPGGPFWKNKDAGAWSIPKGEFDEAENPLDAAKRELKEETGFEASGEFIKLNPIKQKGGKMVHAWAVESEAHLVEFKSNYFEMEWPPRSGKKQKFPEADKAAWFTIEDAKLKVLPSQVPLIEQLEQVII